MKLSIVEKIGFGAGDMAINVVIIAMQLLLAYFYTDIYGLSAADVGVLFVVVRMIDAIIDPAMGVLTDKLNTRWGALSPVAAVVCYSFWLRRVFDVYYA
ncbi:putative membrane protein [Salmonella enterica subsp. enterica]|nr:putative membrane protein [Salmonella enterica subsp. enterica]